MHKYNKLNKELIISISNSAKLNLNSREQSLLVRDIKSILEAFSILDLIDTSKEEPYYHPYPILDVYREDLKEDTLWDPLLNSKNNENNYIKGPKLV